MNFNHAFQEAIAWASDMAWHTCGALLILGFGYAVACPAQRWARHLTRKSEMRRGMVIPLYVFVGVMTLSAILALSALGVAGAAIGVIVTVGLALGAIGDSYYGLKTFSGTQVRIGDFIELGDEGLSGSVSYMSLTTTTLRTSNGSSIIVPNRRLIDRALISRNFDGDIKLRFDLTLDPVADPDTVERELESLVTSILTERAHPAFNAEVG
jgi:small-conductance mechanosensitive channel